MHDDPPRRVFLRGIAALAAAAAMPKFSFAALNVSFSVSPPLPIRLGVASYSFRKFDRAHVIEFMKQLNTPWLNVKDVHLPMGSPQEIQQAADEFRAAGVQLTAAGSVYFQQDDDADMRAKFDYCRIAGIPLIVAGPTPQTLPRLEKFVKEYNIPIAIHNHGPEDKFFPSPFDALKAVKDMDPRMGVCIDVGHAMRAGADVPAAIRAAGPRLYDVHMKDLADAHNKESQVAVGDGVMPVPQIFAALAAIKYPGYVDLEYEINENDPLPGMIKSFAYMRGVLAGMSYTA